MKLVNTNNIPEEYIYDKDFNSRLKTELLGDAVKTEGFYVNIDFIKPGAESTKYHSHSKQEEFFLVIEGSGILRINEKKIIVKKGDIISKPAGKGIAHQFINNGEEILKILDIGTREKDDIITYPDEEIVYIKDKNLVFNKKDSIKNWSSEPNK
ncbi:cupin domain-containing protein [Clostridium felsineum]|uniref:cupin domain-containing protein n=1 Tax=Clostridium felsineum TaxID=36839 RepID=UPI00098BECC1|nr:cupin domain-containing protein [Clostridium felsineum]URZ15908.1 hypothetical protein CLFE_019550 [Clostridium felsineum DSM 794]